MSFLAQVSSPKGAATLVIVALALWHLGVGSILGLGDAEALYFTYSLHLAGGYLDHPPLIGWLIALSTSVLGVSSLAVRLVPTLCHVLTLLGAFVLAKRCFSDSRAAWRAVAVMALVPMFTFGGLAAAPDAPASALWMWTCVVFQSALARARRGERQGLYLDAIGVGALIGATFLAKYTGILLACSIVLSLFHRQHRHLLRGPLPWLSAVVCLIVVSPVILWNAQQGWVSLSHRFVWTQEDFGLSLQTIATTLGGQLGYLGLLAFAFFWSQWQLWTQRSDPERYLLLCLSLLPLAFTLALCFLSPAAEPHWTAQGYLALAVALGGMLGDKSSWSKRRRVLFWSTIVSFGLSFLAIHLLVFTTLLQRVSGNDYEPHYDLAVELYGWSEVTEAVLAQRGPNEPIASSHYTLCSQLQYHAWRVQGPAAPRILCLSEEIDDFDLWGDGSTIHVESLLYVEDDRFGHPPGEIFCANAEREEVERYEVKRGGRGVRSFRLWRVNLRPAAVYPSSCRRGCDNRGP